MARISSPAAIPDFADGVPGNRISLISGSPTTDHAGERVGAFAGDTGAVGSYAGAPGATSDTMGTFAQAEGRQRRGGFGDVDRDEIATFEDGVRRAHVATHHEIEQRLAQAGIEPRAVAGLHQGSVVVLVAAG